MTVRPLRARAAPFTARFAGTLCVALAGLAGPAAAQTNNNFFGNLFKPPGQVAQPQGQPSQTQGGSYGSTDPTELTLRIERLENQLRSMTGQVEQLQYRNQQLEAQVKRYEMELDYRSQQAGGGAPGGKASERVPTGGPAGVAGGGAGMGGTNVAGAAMPGAAGAVPPAARAPGGASLSSGAAPGGAQVAGRRSDAFDPNASANAPGMPQPLGTTLPSMPIEADGEGATAPQGAAPAGTQMATLPPSNTPKDAYDLAYGFVLRQDYGRAAEGFRGFVERFPADRAAPDAYYWLGESDYQRQQYKEAAQSFLKVSTDYSQSTKAPDALLRLGQSLAALGETDAACATFNAVGNKYPRASATVRQQVEREQKRVRC